MCALQIQHMRVSSASSRELSLPLHKLGLQNSFTLANMQPCWRGKKKKKEENQETTITAKHIKNQLAKCFQNSTSKKVLISKLGRLDQMFRREVGFQREL